MGLTRRYKVVFTRETITDEGVVVKEKPPIFGQICESEHHFENVLIPEKIIDETFLQRLYEGLKAELEKPNNCLYSKNIKNEVEINEDIPIQPEIIPLHPR